MNARAVRAALLVVYANGGNQSVTEMTQGTAEGFIISFARD